MEVRRKPSNVKFWITGIACAMYALTMPMTAWHHLIPLALMGVGVFTLSRLIFRGKKYFVPMEQDDPVEKPHSLIADFELLPETLNCALEGRQYQRVFK
jgi:hypothetical protein